MFFRYKTEGYSFLRYKKIVDPVAADTTFRTGARERAETLI